MTDHAPQSAFGPAIIPSCPLMACYRTCKRLLRTCKRPAPDEQEGRINRLKFWKNIENELSETAKKNVSLFLQASRTDQPS